MKQVKIPYSPATPSKSAKASPVSGSKGVALPSASSVEKQTSTSKVKQSVTLEPSPASTYGETAAGDSSPVTPFEHGQHGKFSPPYSLSSTSTSVLMSSLPKPCYLSDFPAFFLYPPKLSLSSSLARIYAPPCTS